VDVFESAQGSIFKTDFHSKLRDCRRELFNLPGNSHISGETI